MKNRKTLAAAALLSIGLASTNALASAPAGVWVKVQKVVYSPDATNPTHVQVHGALMLFDGKSGPTRPYAGYTSPALGYVYYQCPTGQAAICRQEWSELEENIKQPDSECLGFGEDSLPTGTLRQPGTEAENPDVYPIQIGVGPGFTPCQAIGQFLSSEPGGAGGAGGEPSSGGTGASTGGKPGSTGGVSASAGSSGKAPASGRGGSTSTSAGKAGAAAGGRVGAGGAGSGDLNPDKPAEDGTADSKAAGCSIAEATGAASVLGLGAALGIFGLALARRNRQRK